MKVLDDDMRHVLMRTLTFHQLLANGCGCGWCEAGKSHAQHVVEVYEASLVAQPGVPR